MHKLLEHLRSGTFEKGEENKWIGGVLVATRLVQWCLLEALDYKIHGRLLIVGRVSHEIDLVVNLVVTKPCVRTIIERVLR
jgi:hypothetical protein